MAEHDLTPDDRVPRPVLEFYSLKRCVVDSMVQHLVREIKRLEFRLRVPDHEISIKARADAALFLQSVQLGWICGRDLYELLWGDAPRKHATGEEKRNAGFNTRQTIRYESEFAMWKIPMLQTTFLSVRMIVFAGGVV